MFYGSQDVVGEEAANLRVGVGVAEGVPLVVVVKRPGDVQKALDVGPTSSSASVQCGSPAWELMNNVVRWCRGSLEPAD